MVRFPAAAAAFALLLAACGSSIALPVVTPSPPPNPAASPAADLRVQIDLLFGEHVYSIAKLAVAAAAGRKDEFHSYAGLLATNGGDVTALMRSAIGETQGALFGQRWTQGNNLYVDYMVAVATHDKAKADAAMAALTGAYLPQMAQVMSATAAVSMEEAEKFAGDQVAGIKLIVDEAVAGTLPKMYADLRTTYAKAVSGGDAVATGIVGRFADRYPGDPVSNAVDLRTNLATLFLQQGYLITMASGAAAAGSQAGSTAARDAVTVNTAALSVAVGSALGETPGVQLGKIWTDVGPLLVAYAKTGTAADRRSVIDVAGPDWTAGLTAILVVVDDQRAKSFDRLAVDDRAAALLLSAAGEALGAHARV